MLYLLKRCVVIISSAEDNHHSHFINVIRSIERKSKILSFFPLLIISRFALRSISERHIKQAYQTIILSSHLALRLNIRAMYV